MGRTRTITPGFIATCAGLLALVLSMPAPADDLFGGQQGALQSGSLLAERPPYKTVTNARLKKPEAGNWLMYRGRYDSQGYSPLDQINAKNVAKLKPVWSFSTGMREAHQAPPIINDGYMFVTTPTITCWRWMQKPVTCCGATSGSCRKTCSRCTPPTGVSPSTGTTFTWPPPTPIWWLCTPAPVSWSGKPRWRTTAPATI